MTAWRSLGLWRVLARGRMGGLISIAGGVHVSTGKTRPHIAGPRRFSRLLAAGLLLRHSK
jgi:hypothetical protein